MGTPSPFSNLDPQRQRLAYERAAEVVRDIQSTAPGYLSAIRRELNRRKWLEDPGVWAKERLGDTLWSGQLRILHSVKDFRKTAAPTCHEVGKSYDAAIAAGWWLDVHPVGKAFVVTTAPTNPQVRVILWKEIGRVRERGGLNGRVNQTEWKMQVGDREETVAMGRKPNDYSPTAFQGIHAPFVLVLVDEANGVRGQLWDALDSLMANDQSKILAIGNPDDPTGEFFEHCRPGSGWNVVSLGAFDSPNFTGEEMPDEILQQLIGRTYVEEKRKKWASKWIWVDAQGAPCTSDVGVKCVPPTGVGLEDTHPFWQSKVLGQFPVQASSGSLIPLQWIREAQERDLAPALPDLLSLDVGASEDGDPSCCGRRQGPLFRVLYEERQPDTMKTAGRLIQTLTMTPGAASAQVDYIGVGRGVVDRAKEQKLPVHPVSVGEGSTIMRCQLCKHEWNNRELHFGTKRQASKERCPQCNSDLLMKVFPNLLSQVWWDVRMKFEAGAMDIDPADDELAEQLLTIRWEPNSKGQIVVKYGPGPSPNRADALMIAHAPEPLPEMEEFVTW